MHKATCDKCGKVFTKPSQAIADQALRMHAMRQHSTAKRRYKKKSVAVMVNFCPSCGCNLHAVAMGIAMAGGKS